jgi:hypothetical protein
MDSLLGRDGNDSYVLTASSLISEAIGGGNDTVFADITVDLTNAARFDNIGGGSTGIDWVVYRQAGVFPITGRPRATATPTPSSAGPATIRSTAAPAPTACSATTAATALRAAPATTGSTAASKPTGWTAASATTPSPAARATTASPATPAATAWPATPAATP